VRRSAFWAAATVSVVTLIAAASWAAPPATGERVIHITAKKFEFSPATIQLKVGTPVVIELTSADRKHGFKAPDLGIDVTIEPGQPTLVRIVPDKAGTFPFHCSVFCGGGHEDMVGEIVVVP
jgi:cytochrome c oxidase subunit 2